VNARPGELREPCRTAVAVLDRVLQEPPEQMSGDLPEALRCVVRLRDRLIGQRRTEPGSTKVQQRLDRTNAILSVVTGGEYPLVGVRRQRIVEARDALAALAEEL
jgi:hypothetical protein